MGDVIEFPGRPENTHADNRGVESTADVIDIAEVRAARAGIVTPRRALESTLANVDDIAAVAVVAMLKDGRTATSFSTMSTVIARGLLESAKEDVYFIELDSDE